MLINYISNIPQNEFSGGFSAVNHAIWEALREIADVRYVGPVRPSVDATDKFTSKFLRVIGLAGTFPSYAESRLRRIAEEKELGVASNADLDFFAGLTPWVRCSRERPRISWTDCAFLDYIDIYHKNNRFNSKDIERIAVAETEFVKTCDAVLMTSEWAINRAAEHWGGHGGKVRNIGIFGNEENVFERAQTSDVYLLFSSTHFKAKGGYMVLEIFKLLRLQHPNLKLVIIGDEPRSKRDTDAGISYLGYLSKSNPIDHEAYRSALSNAFCIVLPTMADIAPLTPLEGAAFGTPTIAFKSFAIPELIANGKTGILIDPSSSLDDFANAINQLLTDKPHYLQMRDQARRCFTEHFSKAAFQRRVVQELKGLNF